MFKKRSTKSSRNLNGSENKTARGGGEYNKRAILSDSSENQNNEEDDWNEEPLNVVKLKANRKKGASSQTESFETSKQNIIIKPRGFGEDEYGGIEESESIESDEFVFKIKRNKPKKIERNNDVLSKRLIFLDDTNSDKKSDQEESEADEESYEKKYSKGNLAKLIKKQQSKPSQRQENNGIAENISSDLEKNTAGKLLEMDEDINHKTIQVFDEKQIEEIKKKKILLRAKLQSKREREFVTSAGIENETVSERNAAENPETPATVVDEDKINLDMDLSDTDSSEDESNGQIAINTDEESMRIDGEDAFKENEDDETKQKRMEIEDQLYEYELDNGILDAEHGEKEQLHRWELEMMYNGIKQDENLGHTDMNISDYQGSDSKKYGYARNPGADGQKLKELLFKENKLKKYTELPKICKSVEEYRNMKTNNNTEMIISFFQDLKLCKEKQNLNFNMVKTKIRNSNTRIEELNRDIWEIKQELATL